jgi:predicted lysophospholipase L1 biosynthesis ABC-type transport system permease subunit
MNRLNFYLRYSLRSLWRDGTRTFLAGLSVAFGVLSLVAMQLLSNALLHGSMFDQRLQYGGDAQIQGENYGQSFTSSDLDQIETWQQQGLIEDYTLISNGSAAYLRTPTNGHVTFLVRALGIDPLTYPLTGNLVLLEPAGADAADVLRAPTDVLVTRDIADQRGLHVGDSILLSGDSIPIQLTIAGIVGAPPTHIGDSVFYSLTTARLIENREDVVNSISVNWGTAANAEQTVIDSPYQVFIAVDREGAVQSSSATALFDIMLKGAGVLGLLVGGISVSNTLQVILARRNLEIAMLKTLGYRQGDLLALISLETGLIGLAGGGAGALIGTLVAGKLLDSLVSSGSILFDWRPDPVIVIGGIVVGVLTAIVFGIQAILVSSATRPVQLLRDLPAKTSNQVKAGRTALYLLMLVIFGVLVGVVLGSPLEGILYVIGGGIIVVLLRAIFWTVLLLALKLPLPRFPMLRLARANLRQRKTQASLAVLALCAGAFSVTFAALVINNAQSTISLVRGSDAGYNLMIYTTGDAAANAVNYMIAQGVQATYITERVTGNLNGTPITIEGRDSADFNKEMLYSGDSMNNENAALLAEDYASEYAVGDNLTLDVNGQEQTVTLAGFYTVDWNSMSPYPVPIIVSRSVIQNFSDSPLQTRVMGQFPVESLGAVTTTLGQAMPDVFIFSRVDLNNTRTASYQSLFMFAVSIAGLAFVAGAILIANSAGLTVVERRREIGVIKAVGYTSGHVLRVLLSEYGFLGIVSGVLGIIGAVSAILVINLSMLGGLLVIEPLILAGMLLFSVSIALVSAAVVAWQPTRVRPLDVLRYE